MSITKTIPQSESSNKNRKKNGGKHAKQGHSCELKYLTDTEHHHIGEPDTFSKDCITLGRSKECDVRFEDYGTVSSLHAAIEWKNGKWTLVHLSKTNPTYLNNEVVESVSQLHNGDTIRLSNGPAMVFFATTGKETSSIIGYVGKKIKEAIKPYKYMLLGLSLLLLIVMVAGLILLNQKYNEERMPYQQAAEYIYKVNVPKKGSGKTVGTGFVTNDGRFVTAYHVINDPDRDGNTVYARNGEVTLSLAIDSFKYDSVNDWAWCMVDICEGQGLPVQKEIDSLICKDCWYDGYGLRSDGFRFRMPGICHIIGIDDSRPGMAIDSSPNKGHSGSPLLVITNDTVRVVGIISKRINKGGLAIPIKMIYQNEKQDN